MSAKTEMEEPSRGSSFEIPCVAFLSPHAAHSLILGGTYQIPARDRLSLNPTL
jgi:uncharacterized protein involved in copper resistance